MHITILKLHYVENFEENNSPFISHLKIANFDTYKHFTNNEIIQLLWSGFFNIKSLEQINKYQVNKILKNNTFIVYESFHIKL